MKIIPKIDSFVLFLATVIVLAFLFPEIGAITHPINLQEISGYGITFIFFFYGLKLSPQKFTQGIVNWKMHVLIQSVTFILFPLLLIAIKPFFSDTSLWLSLFFVAALPSTVSTSVVMVSLAKGNVPAAIFNATISSFGGIIITPLWVGIFMKIGNIQIDFAAIFIKLVFQILIPIIIGGILHIRLGWIAEKYAKQLKISDQTIVLLIVFTSFCKSIISGVFNTVSLSAIIGIVIGMFVLFVLVFCIVLFSSKKLQFSYSDTVCSIFCGSKKSLLHGVVISKVLFAGTSLSGFILVPIMIYHSIQLIVVGFLVSKMKSILQKWGIIA